MRNTVAISWAGTFRESRPGRTGFRRVPGRRGPVRRNSALANFSGVDLQDRERGQASRTAASMRPGLKRPRKLAVIRLIPFECGTFVTGTDICHLAAAVEGDRQFNEAGAKRPCNLFLFCFRRLRHQATRRSCMAHPFCLTGQYFVSSMTRSLQVTADEAMSRRHRTMRPARRGRRRSHGLSQIRIGKDEARFHPATLTGFASFVNLSL